MIQIGQIKMEEDITNEEEVEEQEERNREERSKVKYTPPSLAKEIVARDFHREEILEINRYVTNNIPFSVLEKIFPLTENVINKAKVFTIAYRIINSVAEYVSSKETREKLRKVLKSCKKEYIEIYRALLRHEAGGFGSYNAYKLIVSIFDDIERNYRVNKLIDIFLVFAEKQTFYDLDRITGIESSRKEGSDIVDKILGEGSSNH